LSRSEKYLGFNDLWLIILGLPIISLIVSIMTMGHETFTRDTFNCVIIGAGFTFVYWMCVRQFIIEYHRLYPNYNFTLKRIVFVLFWLGLIFITVNFTVGTLMHYLFEDLLHKTNTSLEILTTVILIAMMFFLYEGIYYFVKSQLIEKEKNKLERITSEQKLSTLKNQVNPHFLFNSLNTLVTIIPDEPELAINFVQQLSKSYRSILEYRDEKLIPISTELNSLESYIYLLKTRFQGKIQIHNGIKKEMENHFILPLSLQILIENAVKHNITSKTKPLKIDITNDDKFIIVSNNLQRKNQEYNSTKLGLANIKSRYELLADKQIKVKETKDAFTVYLPIITNLDYEDINH